MHNLKQRECCQISPLKAKLSRTERRKTETEKRQGSREEGREEKRREGGRLWSSLWILILGRIISCYCHLFHCYIFLQLEVLSKHKHTVLTLSYLFVNIFPPVNLPVVYTGHWFSVHPSSSFGNGFLLTIIFIQY